jgi:adenine/guanine phosphoribosyltransferase-like PRPP-binding protein
MYDIKGPPLSPVELQARGISDTALHNLHVNQVLSGFCNVANLFSKGTTQLLGRVALAFRSICPLERYDRIVGIPSMGVIVSSLLSLLFDKSTSVAHVLLSLDMWPRPSRLESMVIVDDGIQTGFTMFTLLRELAKHRYRITASPLLTIYRFQDDQVEEFQRVCDGAPAFDVTRNLARTRERARACFTFGVKTDPARPGEYEARCLSDLTDSIEPDAGEAFMEEAKSRILRRLRKRVPIERLQRTVRRVCRTERFLKPCRLLEHPRLLLHICRYFHDICSEKNIDTLIAKDEFGIPLAVGVCLIRMLAGSGPNINLLVAQKGGAFIEGMADLLADEPRGHQFRVATIGTALRTQATESRIERTLRSASVRHEHFNPQGLSLERTHILTVFRVRYLDHVEPMSVEDDRIHEIVSVGETVRC